MNLFEEVPTDLAANLEWRQRIHFECQRKSGRFRKAVLWACEEDPLFWINGFVFQYNPLLRGSEAGPFILWESQRRALKDEPGIFDAMNKGYDLTVQKSREEGGSYLVLLAFMHRWRFRRRQKFLCISHKEELVENPGDHDALFTKVEYVLENLPKWMRGGWEKDNFDTRRKRFFFCPESRGVWTGLATTKKVTIGGRYAAVMLDEFAHIEFGSAIRHRTAATTRCRIFVSTHAGAGTEFNLLCENPRIAKVVLHWTDHPRKRAGLYRLGEGGQVEVLDKQYQFPPDYRFVTSGEPTGGHMPGVRSPFYDLECERIGDPAAVAEELDINPSGSVKQAFDPVLIGQLMLRTDDPWWRGDIAFDPETGVPQGLVEQPQGRIKLWGVKPTHKGLIPGGVYAGGCDISQGTGATPSSLSIGDVDRRQKVLELCRSDLDPREFAALVVAICRAFATVDGTPALLCFESAGSVGGAFEKRCIELRFFRLWERATSTKFLSTSGVRRYGWMPTGNEKDLLLLEYHLALKRREYYNPSKSALKQCLNFRVNKRGRIEHPREVPAPEGYESRFVHGDIVMADALLCKMFTHVGGAAEPLRETAPVNECDPMDLNWRRRYAELQEVDAD
jgi:hypothetical protein